MNMFMQGFIAGARETPQAFFKPLVAVWRLLRTLVKVINLALSSKAA
ncbi:hypothetical protein [Janthinobacterium sp. EB271-G4-7A]|nr:hypothetical protein [Janthinobacterium sp. EB271-G4-7A]MCC7696797.1 hypothetical protein [Janthinobacterium sp. EB271-G4-7A]